MDSIAHPSIPRVVCLFQRRHIYYGWVILAVVSFADLVIITISFGLAILVKPMTKELGWGRGPVALGDSVKQLVTNLIAPLLGAIVDRYGARGLMVWGSL